MYPSRVHPLDSVVHCFLGSRLTRLANITLALDDLTETLVLAFKRGSINNLQTVLNLVELVQVRSSLFQDMSRGLSP